MAYAPPRPSEMFGDYRVLEDGTTVWTRPNSEQQVDRFESFKSAMSDSHSHGTPVSDVLARVAGMPFDPSRAAISAEIAELEKSVSPDVLASIAPQLERMKGVSGDLNKEWLSNSPLSDGLVAYDLQAPAKYIVPRTTPLVNETPRTVQGVGTTARYKRITGVTNSGTGGVADLSPFFNSETASATSGGVTGLRRPPSISYAADEFAILFQEQGLTDSVSMKAFYQSQGYENLRQLSQTALLWATKVGEEKSLLYVRGSATGFAGVLAAPTGVTFGTPVAASAGQTGNTADIPNLYVYVTSNSGRGQSVPSTVASTTGLSAVTGDVQPITWTAAPGALGYTVYAGTATGIANAWFAGTSATNTFTLNFTGSGTGGVPATGAEPSATDSSADINAYDGYLTVFSNPALAGYTTNLNATFSSVNPGTEYQVAFENMYYNNMGLGYTSLADPDIIWIYAKGRVALSDLLKTSPSANYRLTIDQGESGSGVRLGSVVTGISNEVTGKMVDFAVHPYMPLGCSIIHSRTLPIPDSEISNTVEVRNVVDYTCIEWAPIQMSWDQSTYMLGSPLFYAPAYSGTVNGIAN